MNDRQIVELFHLLFLDRLGRKVDKSRYALKGGCNLRFFFLSPRYSEDMDLDVMGIRSDVLRDKINTILNEKAFQNLLVSRGIEIEHVTESKQTETVQRWKLGLRCGDGRHPLPTKIEVSRRGLQPGVLFEPVRGEILRAYALPPILAAHYGPDTSARQKLEALMSRSVLQARDVFDLYLLFQAGADIHGAVQMSGWPLDKVTDQIMRVSYPIFRSQVWAFLPPDEQAKFDSSEVWDAMVLTLVEAIRGKP